MIVQNRNITISQLPNAASTQRQNERKRRKPICHNMRIQNQEILVNRARKDNENTPSKEKTVNSTCIIAVSEHKSIVVRFVTDVTRTS